MFYEYCDTNQSIKDHRGRTNLLPPVPVLQFIEPVPVLQFFEQIQAFLRFGQLVDLVVNIDRLSQMITSIFPPLPFSLSTFFDNPR